MRLSLAAVQFFELIRQENTHNIIRKRTRPHILASHCFGMQHSSMQKRQKRHQSIMHVCLTISVLVAAAAADQLRGNTWPNSNSLNFAHTRLHIARGWGEFGRLGHGDTTSHREPSPLAHDSLHGAVMISCGGHHTVAVTEDGHAVSWGWGSDGQLGRSHLSLLARSPSCKCTHRHDIKSLAPILTQVCKSCSLLITFANIRRKRKHLRPGVANTDKGPVSAARKYNWRSRIF